MDRAKLLDLWRPSSTLNISDIYNHFAGNKTILFYGDSLTIQMFVSFSCLLSMESQATWEMKWIFRDWLGKINCPYGSNHCELVKNLS